MDDYETRRLILRLQMEDLASIWATSTTSADDDNDLDADISLRLYRHELRTADQQIDDRISARAAAEDELRQRNAIRADRQEARRVFQQLNPDEPVPELSETDQLTLTGHTNTCNAPVKNETSSTLGHPQHPDNPTMRASPSLPSHQTIAPTSSVKRSADHLDVIAEPPLKKQASESIDRAASLAGPPCVPGSELNRFGSVRGATTNSEVPIQSSALALSTSGSLKRSADSQDATLPPAKRQEILPQNSSLAFGSTQIAAEETTASGTSDSTITDPTFALFG